MDEGVRACDIIHAYLQNQKCVILWADTSLAGIHPINPVLQNFFECLQRNKKVTVFVAQASSYQKHNYMFWHLFCVFIERMRA